MIGAGAEPLVLGSCDLDEAIHATPAIGQDAAGHGALFVRTDAALYCFGEPAAMGPADDASTPTIALVQSLYDAFAAGDVPRFLSHLDSAVRWNEACKRSTCSASPSG